MCWNAEVSLYTFIFGTISAIIALILNKIPLTTIMILYTVSLIQLIEYFAWRNINNRKIIYYLSVIGSFILLFQISLLNYSYLKSTNEKIQIFIIILIFAITVLYYNFANKKFKMEKGENGHLKWLWIDFPVPIIFIIIFLYLYPASKSKSKYTFIFLLITIIISLYYYYKYKTWGSIWCYIANILWIIIIIYSIIKLFKY